MVVSYVFRLWRSIDVPFPSVNQQRIYNGVLGEF